MGKVGPRIADMRDRNLGRTVRVGWGRPIRTTHAAKGTLEVIVDNRRHAYWIVVEVVEGPASKVILLIDGNLANARLRVSAGLTWGGGGLVMGSSREPQRQYRWGAQPRMGGGGAMKSRADERIFCLH